MNDDDDRPLTSLAAAELKISMVKLRGEMLVAHAETKAQLAAMEAARALQAVEYERRLAGLNHEADQLKNMQSTYLLRETHDRFKETNDKEHLSFEKFQSNLQGKMWIGGAVVLLLAAAMAIVARMIPNNRGGFACVA